MDSTRFRSLGVLLLALVLAACWPQLGYGPGNTRFNPVETELTRDDVASLSERWRTSIDGYMTEPVVADGRVYVAHKRYNADVLDVLGVQAYDRDTGELLWERTLLPTDGPPVLGNVATPALQDGALWVPYWHEGLGRCQGELARLDPETGEVLGAEVTSHYVSDVVMARSTVAYMEAGCPPDYASRLVVRDQATGEIRWTHTFPNPVVATPTIAGGRLFVLVGETLYGFDADGCGAGACDPLWTEPVDSGVYSNVRLTAGPGGSLVTYGPSSDPEAGLTVVVRDGATGDVRWEAEPRYSGTLPVDITGVAVAYGTLYVAGTTEDEPVGPSEATLDAYPVGGCGEPVCSPEWTANLGPARPAHAPTVAGGVVYVSLEGTDDRAPGLAAVDAGGCGASACTELVRVPLIDGSPPFPIGARSEVTAVAEGRVFVGMVGRLVSFGPAAT